MKVTVCELTNGWTDSEREWEDLADHVGRAGSDLVLLPEMCFYPWIARTRQVDPGQWQSAVESHERWTERFSEMPASILIGSRPVVRNGLRQNEGFIWERGAGYRPVHAKHYLPNEEGFWEAEWYRRGNRDFHAVAVRGVHIGFLICTELWFNAHAREYMKQGIHVLVCPRATPAASIDRWIAGGRTAAVVSGAFCLSSNFNGPNVEGIDFGGAGWVMEPEGGNVLGVTSQEHPFLTMDIDPEAAEKAKETYPRYVRDYE
ncbi:MAG: carbon-nitrogen hydrolase family protein [Deltaproteobacteria bacterium]|nr:carbon-nitrogen hydrolase family protein [Deltaproteobacteria bacterium]